MSDQPPVIPRPLHNQRGTIRAQARQTLAEIDRRQLYTSVQTGTLILLLEWLVDLLADTTPVARRVSELTVGALVESDRNPNLSYWQREAEADEDRAGAVEPADE